MMKKGKALLMLLLAILAGCTNGNGFTHTEGNHNDKHLDNNQSHLEHTEPFTITLRHIQIGEAQKFRKAILDDVIAQTESEIPGLTFELDGVEDQVNRFTKLPAEMAAGNPPKIFDLFGGSGDAIKYAKAGRLLDLTPILEELEIADKFLYLNQFTWDGKVYGLPIGGNTEGFFYNKQIFVQHGISEPSSWKELEQAAAMLYESGVTPLAMGSKNAWVPLMLVNTLIGRYAGPESIEGFSDGTTRWDSPEVVAAFAKYAEWVEKGYFTQGELGLDYADMLNQFLSGNAAMMFDGSWRSSVFKDPIQAGELLNQVGYFAVPPVPDGRGDQTYVNGNYSNGYGFSADLNERELLAVKAFIKNMYNEEMQLRGLLEDGVLPSMKISQEAWSQVDDPIVIKVMSIMNASGGTFPHYDATVPSTVYNESELLIQKLIAGETTPHEMGDKLQELQLRSH